MKEDEARFQGGHRLVVYVEREDGSYGPLETTSYLASNYLGEFFENQEHRRAQCLGRLVAGEVSPVGFYLELLGMAEADLAARVGVSRHRLRQHLTPAGFAKVTAAQLRRYAEIFGVPVANLFQVFDAAGPGLQVAQRPTANPWVVRTTAGEKA